MSVTAADVKALRDKTGCGMMACQKALKETNGNTEEAMELLRKKGEAKAGEKSERAAGEGVIAVSGRTALVLNCETDFVARNEDFQAYAQELADVAASDGADAAKALFEEKKGEKVAAIGENLVLGAIQTIEGGDTVGSYVHSNKKVAALVALEGGSEEAARDVAMHATAMDPLVANPEDVPADSIEKEKAIYREQLINEGKPEQIIDKIIEGKVNKFCAERALSSQAFVKDPSQTVAQYLGDGKLVGFVRLAV